MCRRIYAMICLALMASAGWAGEPAPKWTEPAAKATQPAAQGTETAAGDVAAELRIVKDELRRLSNNLTQVVERVSEQQTQIGQLRTELVTLTDQINEDIARQQQILEAISQSDSSGRPIPRLSAAMQSDQFRQEMQQVVNQSLGTVGTLRISNLTSDFHRVLVNRTEFSVPAGQTLTLQVPAGTVSTQLPGRELKNWTIAGPRYEQSVEIVPDTTTTTTYTARPVSAAAPVIYSPLAPASNVVYMWR